MNAQNTHIYKLWNITHTGTLKVEWHREKIKMSIKVQTRV